MAQMADTETFDAPIELNIKYNQNNEEPVLYRTLIGCFIYRPTIWPDISYADQVVSQFMPDSLLSFNLRSSCKLQRWPVKGCFCDCHIHRTFKQYAECQRSTITVETLLRERKRLICGNPFKAITLREVMVHRMAIYHHRPLASIALWVLSHKAFYRAWICLLFYVHFPLCVFTHFQFCPHH